MTMDDKNDPYDNDTAVDKQREKKLAEVTPQQPSSTPQHNAHP